MSRFKVRLMLIASPVMMIAGWGFLFAMIIERIRPTYFLNVVSYVLLMTGFFLGMYAVFFLWKGRKSKQEIKELRKELQGEDSEIPPQYSPYQSSTGINEEKMTEYLKDELRKKAEENGVDVEELEEKEDD